MRAQAIVRVMTVLSVVFLATAAWAQTASTGAIASEVEDATGAVFPGVTVEAASAALIEKVRSAVTDSQGRYQLCGLYDVRPSRFGLLSRLKAYSLRRRRRTT